MKGSPNVSDYLKQHEHLRISSSAIKINKTISKGTNATVKEAEHGNKKVALKKFHMDKFVQNESEMRVLHSQILREFVAMVDVSQKCEHILEIIGFVRDSDNDSFMLVMPLMAKTLKDEIHKGDWNIKSEDYIKKQYNILLSIIAGLRVLHENNIIHRDLKPANILIDYNGVIKLADLGEAKALSQTNTKSKAGSPVYLAPEVKYGMESKTSVQADIFSLGVIIIEINIKEEPKVYPKVVKPGQTGLEKETEVRRGELNKMTDIFLKKLAEDCLEENPESRPTAKQLFEFRF